ncbi:MAG TPA: acyl-CoA dehydrogenase, partial [Dehalococcoidia bacterium]|nr:acyl-CoA dehydrogenase [Dehalococcoidia bacterium]
MDLSLTEQQELLKTTARDFMEREASKDILLELEETESGYSDELWQKASDIGWLGMLVPEQYGGSGSSLTDAAVVYEQMGAGPLSGPFFSSGVLGALTILEAGTE